MTRLLLAPLLLLTALATPLAAQLTVTGSGTSLTVDGASTIHGTTTVTNDAAVTINGTASLNGNTTITERAAVNLAGNDAKIIAPNLRILENATVDLTGENAELDANLYTQSSDGAVNLIGRFATVNINIGGIGDGATLTMTGLGTRVDADSRLGILENGLLRATGAGTPIIEGEILAVNDGGTLEMLARGGEVFVFDDFTIQDGGTFRHRGYGEFDVMNWAGDVIFQIGGDASSGDFGTALGQASQIDVTGTVTTELVGGYSPVSDQRYTLIELDNQFSSATANLVTPGPGWVYDLEQNFLNIEFKLLSLPVELLSFTGRWEGKFGRLDWTTATESGSSHFVVERQNLVGGWDAAGTVQAAGESITEKAYTLLDENPGPTNPIYYRLRQVDLDGTETLSAVVALQRTDGPVLTVFPNPATDVLNVNGTPATTYQITDATGRLVTRGTLRGEGRTKITLPTQLTGGTYILRTDDGEVRRFVVRK